MSIATELAAISATLDAELPLLRAALAAPSWWGSTWPTSPSAGQALYRSDLGLWAYYTGAQWLTVELFTSSIIPIVFDVSSNGATMGYGYTLQSAIYVDSVVLRHRVLTTSNISNYYTFALQADVSNILTVSTVSNVADTNVFTKSAIGAFHTVTNAIALRVTSKVGSPGTLSVNAIISYRIVL